MGTPASSDLPLGVDRGRVAFVDPRSPGGWEVPARLPDPGAVAPYTEVLDANR